MELAGDQKLRSADAGKTDPARIVNRLAVPAGPIANLLTIEITELVGLIGVEQVEGYRAPYVPFWNAARITRCRRRSPGG